MAAMSQSSSSAGQHTLGVTQSKEYTDAVGRGLSASTIREAAEFAKAAESFPIYAAHREDKFIYEMLRREGWAEKTRKWVDEWIENEDNVRRAERSVARKVTEDSPKLRRGFCLFRLKELDSMSWEVVPAGLGSDGHTPQTVVFIALVDLSPENGFFMQLNSGEDVCVDSKAQMKFAPTGGGVGIFISLNL